LKISEKKLPKKYCLMFFFQRRLRYLSNFANLFDFWWHCACMAA